MSSWLHDFFQEEYRLVDRYPVVTVTLPGTSLQLGILNMVWKSWMQLTALLLFQMGIATVLAIVIYFGIVQPPKVHRTVVLGPYLVGFGIVLPVVLGCPFWIYQQFSFQSTLSSASLICLPLTVSLRCLEAMFGFTPVEAQESLRNFILYYASLMDTKFDKETRQPVASRYFDVLWQQLQLYGQWFLLNTLLLSLLKPFGFRPLSTPLQPHSTRHSWDQMLQCNHLVNNLISAVLLSASLSFSLVGLSLLFHLLTGVQTNPAREYPLLRSKSPSDFWARRWNNLIHGLLKRGVYKPVRSVGGAPLAVLAAFLASGLIHEYVWLVLFLPYSQGREECGTNACFVAPPWGKCLVFFGYNGILILLEKSRVGRMKVFLWMQQHLPTVFKSFLVVALALPVGHLFTGDWIVGGYFDDLSILFPLVVVVKNE